MFNKILTVSVVVSALALGACSDSGSDTKTAATASKSTASVATPSAPAAVKTAAEVSVVETPVVETAAVEPAAVETEQGAAKPAPVQHVVKGVVTQWRPLVLFIQPGDTVVFRQMSGHDTTTMEGLYPSGAEAWQSTMGAEGFSITPTVPGAYIYKCTPHASSGMIGAIVVGDLPPGNLAELESSPLNKGMTGRTIRKLKKALEAAP